MTSAEDDGQRALEDADRRARHAYATGQIGIGAWLASIAGGSTPDLDASLPPAPARDPARGGSHHWYPADRAVLAELAAIASPRDRYKRAAEITDARYAAQQEVRQRQVLAAVAAHVRHGTSQVACYAEAAWAAATSAGRSCRPPPSCPGSPVPPQPSGRSGGCRGHTSSTGPPPPLPGWSATARSAP